MAADDLAQMYHERWQTANHRIFELEVMLRDRNKEIAAYQSKIIAGDSSNESRAHLSDIKTEAAAQMQAKDKELARLQEQIRDRDMQVLRLQQQLDLKKATIAKARKAIEGRSLNPIASLLRAPMGDEGGINRARLKRERRELEKDAESEEEDDIVIVEPKPKRAAIEAIDLDDDEDDNEIAPDRKRSPSREHAGNVPKFDYKVCMEPLTSTSTQMCDRSVLPDSVLEAASKLEARWYGQGATAYQRRPWAPGSRSDCLREKLRKQATRWRPGDDGSVAGSGCVQRGTPCFKWTGEGIFMLPLHEDDRTEVVAGDEIVEGRWIR